MKYYIEAFNEKEEIILGNLDGQGIIYSSDFRNSYKRTNEYKNLLITKFRKVVAYHEIREATTRKVIETVLQNKFKMLGKKVPYDDNIVQGEKLTLNNLFKGN